MPSIVVSVPAVDAPLSGVVLALSGFSQSSVYIYRQTLATGALVMLRNSPMALVAGSATISDPEARLNVEQRWRVYDKKATIGGAVILAETEIIRLESDISTLRPVLLPQSARYVTVADEQDEEWTTRSIVYDVIGANDPIIVADSRRTKSGTLIFLTEDMNERNQLINMMKDGVIQLFRSACAYLVDDLWFVARNITEVRLGFKRFEKLLAVEYQSVQPPPGDVYHSYVPTGTWQEVMTANPTWAEVLDRHDSWLDVWTNATATARAVPDDIGIE